MYIHYLNVLLANGREMAEYRLAALWPNEEADRFDAGAFKRAEAARRTLRKSEPHTSVPYRCALGVGRTRWLIERIRS